MVSYLPLEKESRNAYTWEWGAGIDGPQSFCDPLQCIQNAMHDNLHKNRYLFGGCNATRVIYTHIPLMQSSHCEQCLALDLWDGCILKIGHSTTCKLEQPCFGNMSGDWHKVRDELNILQPMLFEDV